jgi:hypothetical protein
MLHQAGDLIGVLTLIDIRTDEIRDVEVAELMKTG